MKVKEFKFKEDNFNEEVGKLKKKYSGEIKEEKKVEERDWQKTVGAIIVDGRNLLLIKKASKPFQGTWTLPEGHIEKNEVDFDAIIRLVKKKTCLNFKPEYFGSYEESFEKLDWFSYFSVFTGKFSGKIDKKKINKNEIEDINWFNFDDLENVKIGFEHKKIIEEYLGAV
jgi:8-oxo-dGTP diphosphatase